MTSLFIRKCLLSILSGLMLTISFPSNNLDWMAWFAMIPLLISIEGEDRKTSFRLGITAGLAHYITLMYWIINVLSTYGGLNIIISIFLLILLCLYLSIFTGIFAAVFSGITRSFALVFTAGSLWVALEYLRSIILTGFPWCLLGHSQYNRLSLIQISDISGVYGISFIIVCVNVSLYLLIRANSVSPRKGPLFTGLSLSAILIGLSFLYGNQRLKEYEIAPDNHNLTRIAVVQGNIDQSLKWDPDFQSSTLDRYLSITRSGFRHEPDIIVWPETALPFFFTTEREEPKQLYEIPVESGASFIFGTPAYKRGTRGTEFFNRAICISPDGDICGSYDKNHLVPFGEYVPLKRLLPFVYRLVPSAGDFSPGRYITPIELKDDTFVGILICYEVIFPDISAKHVKKGAEILINITNDAWFGLSSAPFQHLSMSVFRAVENRRPVVRAANTGFSAFIDSRGVIEKRGELFTEELLVSDVNRGNNHLTFYSIHGDIFARGITIICMLIFFLNLCYKPIINKLFIRRK